MRQILTGGDGTTGQTGLEVITMVNENFAELYGFNVTDYGASGDRQITADGSVTTGTAALTTIANNFVPGDTGKTIRVFGAGAAGADLITTMTYVSPTAATLGTNASTTVSNASVEWGTDNTTPIQNTINACFAAGGGVVYFPNGVYLIAGPLITALDGINPNCQIYIPLLNKFETHSAIPSITLVGESAPANFGMVLNATGGAEPPLTGVILKSIITGSGTLPAVLGSSFDTTAFIEATNLLARCVNIRIRVKSITGTAHVAPTMGAFNAAKIECFEALNCSADTESPSWNSIEPTSNAVIGFNMPNQANKNNCRSVNCFAKNYYTGIEIKEHCYIEEFIADTCYRAARFNGTEHPYYVTKLHANACKYIAAVEDGANGVVSFIYAEQYPGITGFDSKWYDLTYSFIGTSTTSATHLIFDHVSTVQSGGGEVIPTFSGNFVGCRFTNLYAEIKFTNSTSSFTNVDYPWAQIRYIGTAVSSDNYIPDFQLVHKQTGADHNVARILGINESSSQGDKALGSIHFKTNGNAQTGKIEIFVHDGSTGRIRTMDLRPTQTIHNVPLVMNADISPAQITADQNNYAPTGGASAAVIRMSSDAARALTGLSVSQIDGREVTIYNIGSNDITGTAESASSTAANRFATAWTLTAGQALRLIYDGTSSRWRKLV